MSPDPQHHDDLPELPDSHEVVASPPGPAAPPASPGAPPPLRVLDKAPRHLRLAAMVVVAGSVLPWMPGRIAEPQDLAWLLTLLSKAIMGAAACLWMQQVAHNWGPRLKGVLGQLAELELKPAPRPAEDDKARRARPKAQTMHLVHPFPTGLHALALVLAAVALFVAARDPRVGFAGLSSGTPEVAMLGWAAFTWVHIGSYERWGSFNPLFPLLFLGMLFAGAAAVIGAFTGQAEGAAKVLAILGGGGVAAGGGLAAYTIAEAMMQAKKEGDRKKAEALEARKAAREKKRE